MSVVLEDEIINLGEGLVSQHKFNDIKLNLYPNPAKDELFVTAYMRLSNQSNKITLKLCSLLGEEITIRLAESAETMSFSTNGLPNGTYFIRAEYQTSNYGTTPPLYTTEPFIIKR